MELNVHKQQQQLHQLKYSFCLLLPFLVLVETVETLIRMDTFETVIKVNCFNLQDNKQITPPIVTLLMNFFRSSFLLFVNSTGVLFQVSHVASLITCQGKRKNGESEKNKNKVREKILMKAIDVCT